MTEDETPLDAAFRAMEAAPDDDAAERRFHERVLDAELFVLLEAEPEGAALRPRIFVLEEGRFALAFDRDSRLAAFVEAPAPYAALAGRRLVQALAGSGVGLGLNLGVAPSQTLLPAAAIDWLAERAAAPAAAAAEVAGARAVRPPRAATPALIAGLDAKVAAMAGRIEAAWLVAIVHADGVERLTLAVAGAAAAAEPGIAAALAEAAQFSAGAAGLDVGFLGADPGAEGAARAAIERHGLRFDPPRPEPAPPPRAPGSDPNRPPKLR